MKKKKIYFTVLTILLSNVFFVQHASYAEDQETNPVKKYDVALILPAGGLKLGVGLGLVAGIKEMEKKLGFSLDVIIPSCGFSWASLIINSHSDPERWLEIAKSQEFFELMSQYTINKEFATPDKIKKELADIIDKLGGGKPNPPVMYKPDLFSKYLCYFPHQTQLKEANEPFSDDNSRIRVVSVGCKLLFKKEEVVGKESLREGKPLYKEVFFTDPSTKEMLKGFCSPISEICDTVSPQTEVYTSLTKLQACTSTSREPYIGTATEIQDPITNTTHCFISGSVDLYPIEVGKFLANRVIMVQTNPIDFIQSLGYKRIYGFDINARRLQAEKQKAFAVLDIRDDVRELNDKYDFAPQAKVNLLTMSFAIKENFPDTIDDFRTMIQKQYEYGLKKARLGMESVVKADKKN